MINRKIFCKSGPECQRCCYDFPDSVLYLQQLQPADRLFVQVNETLMQLIVTDHDGDYINVTDFHLLDDHVDDLVDVVCAEPLSTSPPHVGESTFQFHTS